MFSTLKIRNNQAYNYLAIVFLTLIDCSCEQREEEFIIDSFEVSVQGVGLDCGLLLIDFKESDLQRIKMITNSDWGRFYAFNLDRNKFGSEGTSLWVRVRKTLDSELSVCTTLGPSYPWVTILESIELKN